jgi:ABC-type transport system involved in Fe-S cluster assembly fused permease/ATPase subunit
MFERLTAWGQAAAAARAARRRAAIAERLAEALPPGIAVTVGEEGVTLSGRALGRRLALDRSARAAIGDLR